MRVLKKPPFDQAAFTLIELIVVIILLAIVSAYVIPKFSSSSSYQQDTVIEQLISTGQLTQQLAMNDSTRVFSLSVQSNQIDLLVDGSSFSVGELSFPLQLSSNITLSPASSISYDGLGATSSSVIAVSGESSINVCFEATGLIHRC